MAKFVSGTAQLALTGNRRRQGTTVFPLIPPPQPRPSGSFSRSFSRSFSGGNA